MLMLLVVPLNLAFAEASTSFRYRLANFSGPAPSQWARLAVDPEDTEVYSLNQRQNEIRVFDEHGAETYPFEEVFPSTADIAIGDDGDIFVLTARYQTSTIHLCNCGESRVCRHLIDREGERVIGHSHQKR
jgi:DNA-binding beta-propeller fold protein YncE